MLRSLRRTSAVKLLRTYTTQMLKQNQMDDILRRYNGFKSADALENGGVAAEQLAQHCPFCSPEKISEGLITYSPNRHFYALYNLRPIFRGHFLVIPTKHVAQLSGLPFAAQPDVAIEYATFMQDCITAMLRCYGTESYNMLVQEGLHSGQSIRHLHIHLFPRHKADVEIAMLQQQLGIKVDGNQMKTEIVQDDWYEYFKKVEHTARALTVAERQKEASLLLSFYEQVVAERRISKN